MVSKVKVAFVLLLVTLVPVARATSDDDAMLDFPAFDMLNAVSSRNLRSSKSLTTTNEDNDDERVFPFESSAELKLDVEHLGTVIEKSEAVPSLRKDGETSLPKKESEISNALKEESEKTSVAEGESINELSADEALKRQDNVAKRLIENDKYDIGEIEEILKGIYFRYWFKMNRSAQEIHSLLGLTTGPDLLKQSLVWIWLDYVIWNGRSNELKTIKILEEKFGNNAVVAKMFEDLKKVSFIKDDYWVRRLKSEFTSYWLKPEHDLKQFRLDLIEAGFNNHEVEKFVEKYNTYHPKKRF